MEENSKVSMEADVSSTTGDALEAENVTENLGNLETIIVVENVSEESLNSSIKLFAGPEPCESSVEVPLSTSLQSNDQDNYLKGKPESNMLSQKSVSSPSKDISKNNDESKSHHQQKTYNNKHKSLGKPEQLQVLSCKEKSPLKTDNHQNTCNVQDRSPLKSDARQKILITKDKTPLKIVQVHKISIEKIKSPYKPDQSQITSNGKETSLLKTDQPQKILKEKHSSPSKLDQPQKILNDETTPSKTIQLEDTDKDKALKTDQSLKIYNVKHNSLSISNQPDLMLIESSQDTNDSTNALNSESLVEKTIVTPMEVSTNALPENNLPADQKESSSNESADKTMDNKMDKEEEMSESNSIIDNCEKEDSQSEINSEIEKDHNKNISRELKSLIKSAKESKIISECNQVTSKTRKSRSALDTSFTSTVESDKIQDVRRSSINSQKSNSSEKSEKTPKRSMRSQNPEFVNKVKQFLNSVTGKFQKGDSDDEMDVKKETQIETVYSPSKKKKHVPVDVDSSENTNKLRTDPYCWRCHWAVEQGANEKGHPPMQCTVCPRAIHFKCLTSNERNKITADKSWVCPECLGVLHAESSETRSPAMKKVSLGLLCELLHYALERMKNLNGVEPFLQPVDRTSFPDYDKYVVHPMDLSLMKDNITEGLYGSTEAFLADVQWILHNSIIFNTLNVSVQSKLTGAARALVRSCRAEMGEIEACPECYSAAHARRPTWFTDVCSTPHMLLWAKLKGFPYWPAKGMSVSSTGMVDVRFFGAHDRAWVPARDCYLYCERDPNNFRSKRQDILDSMQEAEQHIRNISRKYGQFVYPPFKTPFDPTKLMEQLKIMIPTFDGDVGDAVAKTSPSPPTPLGNSRTASKSSKTSLNDGEVSESEDAVSSRKMADGADAHRDEDLSLNKNKSTDVISKVENVEKEKEVSRKRRRSDLEEAVITIMDTREKRRKIEADVVKTEITKKVNEEKENVSEINKTHEVNEKDQDTSSVKVVPTSSKMDTDPTIATPKVKPIKISISRDNDKAVPIIMKPDKKDVEKDKIGEKNKSEKRRNSRNKSINTPNGGRTEKKDTIVNVIIKEKKDREKAGDPKSKDRLNIDDNTSLAVIAREGAKGGVTCLPTISCVRSLSTAQNSDTSTNSSKLVEVTVSNSNIFIPTGTNKLQINDNPPLVGRVGVRAFARMTSPERQTNKQTDTVEVEIKSEPMDLEDEERQVEKMDLLKQFSLRPVNPQNAGLREVRVNKVVVAPLTRKTISKPPDVRIKAKKTFPQPRKIDEGRSELNGKNSMVYIPIQPPTTQAPARTTRTITINGTNTQTVRPQSTNTTIANNAVNTTSTPLVSVNASVQPSCTIVTSTTSSVAVNQTPIIGQVAQLGQTIGPLSNVGPTIGPLSNVGPTIGPLSNVGQTIGPISNVGQTSNFGPVTVTSMSNVAQLPTIGQMNAINQVATNVHTVPLITSVNGQWTFSLQPIMSVGGLDENSPLVNGISDRSTSLTPMVSLPTVQPLPVPALNTICSNPDNPGEPPRLQQKPLLNPLDPGVAIGAAPPPSSAGPLTAKLNQNAVKLTDFFRTLLEDTLDKVDEPAAQATLLKMQVEHTQWRHLQEIRELKHNHELTIMEMRASYEKEKARAVSEARRTAQAELEAAVKATKAKQWCANCSQEAQFYCCWNTSYCDYPCQKTHWNTHYATCAQQRNTTNNCENGNTIERLQPPENLPVSGPTPTLTVGTKLTPSRVFSQDSQPPKTSIIVSMMEDHSGNQTMKCVGTYKPPSSSQVSPLIINKQIMNNEENSKKVVTSGGYLIVGAGTPPRRTHTIQYYT